MSGVCLHPRVTVFPAACFSWQILKRTSKPVHDCARPLLQSPHRPLTAAEGAWGAGMETEQLSSSFLCLLQVLCACLYVCP